MDLPKTDLRLTLLVSFLAACGGVLGSALWYIQVIRGEDYERLATGNRIRLATIPAPRGTIFDRGGNILADNRPGFEAAVSLSEVSDKKKLVDRLSEVLEIEPERIQARLNRFRQKPFEPVRLATDIGIARATVFAERSPEGDGVEVRVNPVRNYPYGPALVHLIGYVGQIDPRELKRLGDLGYGSQDDIGKIGVEQSYDLFLRGVGGGEQIQVNAGGFRDRILSSQDPQPGSNLHLAVDLKAQLILDEILEGRKGAAVVLDPRNGDLLALVSKPSFDPNLLVRPVDEEYLQEIFSHPDSPILNRALGGEYPPGSPFKLVVALAGFRAGKLNPEQPVTCASLFPLGETVFKCWKEGGHGPLAFRDAIKHSCNVYFYRLGLDLGFDRIREAALLMGFGEKPGIGLTGEKEGFVPSRQWKKSALREGWYPGDTANLCIGQGYIRATPLQLAGMGCVIASRGKLFKPRLVLKITNPKGETIEEFPTVIRREIRLPDRQWDDIWAGMYGVVNEAGGTGTLAAHPRITVYGKSGTVQVGAQPDYSTHAWFLAFVPTGERPIVLALILEEPGSGGEVAAPVAGEFLKKYYEESEKSEVGSQK
jgi:penicillin-binding protein 2